LTAAPATVAFTVSQSEALPIGRRKSHQIAPFATSETRLTAAASRRRAGEAVRMRAHVSAQSMSRAKATRRASVAAVRSQRPHRR
jgi:hypothetical protein